MVEEETEQISHAQETLRALGNQNYLLCTKEPGNNEKSVKSHMLSSVNFKHAKLSCHRVQLAILFL